MFRNTAVAALLATGTVLGLSACGTAGEALPADSSPTQGAPTQDKREKDAENPSKDASELKKDVTIVACESGDGIGVSATLEVTNSLPVPMEYLGTITFRDPAGTELTDGVFNTGTLAPGEKSTEEVPAANVYTVVKGATCQVGEVRLDEPE